MFFERVYLTEDKRAFLDAYITDVKTYVHDAMLVIPGGGYGFCSDREGEPVALAFLAKGFNAFVLTYRVDDDDRYPDQLCDVASALLYIKKNSQKYNIDPDRIFGVGFSAGGHLLGTLATVSERQEVLDNLCVGAEELSLAGVILSYPVLTALHNTHEGSFVRLAGKEFADISQEERTRLSVENHVTKSSPPAFIWHTAEDKVVPLDGSFILAKEYVDKELPVTFRVYPYGVHGISLANEITDCSDGVCIQPIAAHWVDEACEWINTLKKTKKDI